MASQPGAFARDKRPLQALFVGLGSVAIMAGTFAVLTGSSGQLEGSETTASEESEFRFFAAFWIAYGVAALWVAPRVDRETTAVRALALALFVGGLARGLAWISAGPPHAVFIALMSLELLIPPLVVWWQSRIVGGRSSDSGYSGSPAASRASRRS